MTPRKVFRQRSPVAIAIVSGIVSAFVLGTLVVSGRVGENLDLLGWLAFVLVGMWAVFLRPAVELDPDAVELRNIVRDVRIPWVLVEDVDSRWNLKVWTEERAYTAWAISSSRQRPKSQLGLAGSLTPRLSAASAATADDPSSHGAVTARGVAEWIRLNRLEYDNAIAQGETEPPPDPRVESTVYRPAVTLLLAAFALALALNFG